MATAYSNSETNAIKNTLSCKINQALKSTNESIPNFDRNKEEERNRKKKQTENKRIKYSKPLAGDLSSASRVVDGIAIEALLYRPSIRSLHSISIHLLFFYQKPLNPNPKTQQRK